MKVHKMNPGGLEILKWKLCHIHQVVQRVIMRNLMNVGNMIQLKQPCLIILILMDGILIINSFLNKINYYSKYHTSRTVLLILFYNAESKNYLLPVIQLTPPIIPKYQRMNFCQQLINKLVHKQFLNKLKSLMCGNSNEGEKLRSNRVPQSHTSDKMQIKMKFNLVSSNGFWGLRVFRLFVVKCYETCLAHSGSNKNDCQACKSDLYYIILNVKMEFGIKTIFQLQDFQAQIGWTISNVYNNKSPFQTCDNTNILRGFSLSAKDAQIALDFNPNHTKIRKINGFKFIKHNLDFEKSKQIGDQIIHMFIENLDFEFLHNKPSINLLMTSILDQFADEESWGIRNFELLYGVPNECSYPIIDFNNMPEFIGNRFTQSSDYSFDQSLQIKQQYLNLESLCSLTLNKLLMVILQFTNQLFQLCVLVIKMIQHF
ncbi:unnamed protein product [Paramecium sonneborni]|uniref:Uncharacterized protein n=1 Tax=Paramecium sonneborni TaxID=65129 RepID=A0A8S1RSD2_9CILI|nr:unnamed protein product [Paramecium sonneborni]